MSPSPSLFLLAGTAILVLACISAGCYSAPAPVPPGTTGPAPVASGTPAPAPVPPGSTGPAPAAGSAVMIKNFAFSPAVLNVKAGTTVTWTNDDGAPHTIVSDAGSPASFSSPNLAHGATFSFTFAQAGSYPYHCSIHPSMKGTVVVGP